MHAVHWLIGLGNQVCVTSFLGMVGLSDKAGILQPLSHSLPAHSMGRSLHAIYELKARLSTFPKNTWQITDEMLAIR